MAKDEETFEERLARILKEQAEEDERKREAEQEEQLKRMADGKDI